MKKRTQTLLSLLIGLAVLLLRMRRGLSPPAPQPGLMPGGAMAEPLGAAVGGLLAGALAGGLVLALLWAVDRLGLSPRRQGALLAALALALGRWVWYAWGRGSRPFARLEGADIAFAQVTLSPPDVTVELTGAEREELAALLRAAVVRGRDDSWTEYAGQGVIYALELEDGRSCTVTAYNPFLILDGVGYRTEYEPCQALERFGNRLFEGRGGADGEGEPRGGRDDH